MKNLKYIFYLLTIGLITSSCSDYLDVNDNPNAVSDPPIDGLLASVTYNTGYNTSNLGSLSAYWVQYLAGVNQATPIDVYEFINTNGTWNGLYLTLADNYEMMMLAEQNGATHHQAIGKVIEAYSLLFISDYWNGGPYEEALDGSTSQPVWETGERLYAIASQNLDDALALFNQDPTIVVNSDSDLIYFGDTDQWVKAIYALKARMALHTGDLSSISNFVNQSFSSNADDMQMDSFQVRNPWAQTAINNDNLLLGGFISAQYIDAMNGTTYSTFDPRLPFITDETQFADYRGTVNGEGRVGDGISDEECYLELDNFYSSTNSPIFLFTYAELKFIEAEALLTSNPGAAYAAYLDGITANMDKIGVPGPDQTAYLASPDVAVGVAGFGIDEIMKEKYKALFLSPETWNDARRYDYNYEDFSLPTGALLPGYIQLAPTPNVELTTNGGNASDHELTDNVWWD